MFKKLVVAGTAALAALAAPAVAWWGGPFGFGAFGFGCGFGFGGCGLGLGFPWAFGLGFPFCGFGGLFSPFCW